MKTTCVLLLVLAGGAVQAARPQGGTRKPGPEEAAAAALRTDIDRIFAESGLPKTVVAARVVTLPGGGPKQVLVRRTPHGAGRKVVYSVRAAEPLIPASTMKLVTTAACWDRLGRDWRIRTRIGHIPSNQKGKPPDLAVIGGGDPNLSGRLYGGDVVGAFRQWAKVLKGRGITAVGRILLDDTLFEAQTVHPRWPADQRHKWYEAPVGALNLNDNCIDVHVAPGKVGGPARVRVEPETACVTLVGAIRTVAERGRHRFSLTRLRPTGGGPGIRLRVGGRYWVKAKPTVEHRTVFDPGLFFGAVLAETLRAAGLTVGGGVVRRRLVGEEGVAADFVPDLTHTSRLDQTVTIANQRSQGLYAECLFKLLGAYGPNPDAAGRLPPPQVASWKTGAEEVRRWLADRGIPSRGCVIDDGSGLSKTNRLTAACVTEILTVMFQRHGEAFVRTLAVAGREGSLRKRMKNTAAEGRVWAKTGRVAGVSALSGYVRTRSGRWLAFSILMNDVPWGQLWRARLAQDKVCIRLVEFE